MPIRKVKGGFQWGKSGKVYKKRSDAAKQAAAAHAAGFSEATYYLERIRLFLEERLGRA
jgi:hypothetical protein